VFGRWALRLAAGLAIAGVLAALGILFALGIGRGRPHTAGQAAGATAVEALAATASPTPAASLTPAQQECLRRAGLLDQYLYVRTDKARQAILTGVRYCVDTLSGIPLESDPAFRAARRPVVTPRPLRPENYGSPLGAGRLDSPGNPARPGQDAVLNMWHELTSSGAVRVTVTAGVSGADPLQGLILVLDYPAGKPVAAGARYPTPTRHGAVKIVDAVRETLKLQADDGTIFYFDVASRQYVAGFPATGATPAATPAGP